MDTTEPAFTWQRLLVGATVAFLTWQAVSTYIQYRRLSHIKGPLIAALTPLWLFYHTLRGDVYLALEENFKKYGSPLRVAPGLVQTSDPRSFRQFVTPKSPWQRGKWFDCAKFDPRAENILSMRDEKEHHERRQQLIPGYTGADVPTLEVDVDQRVIELKALIAKFAANDESFDLAQVIHYFTLDVMSKIGFGEALGFLSKNQDLFNYIKTSSAFFPVMELSANFPSILKILQSPLMASAAPKPTDRIGFGAILGYAHAVVEERLKSGASYDDMMGSFMKNGLNKIELESESILLILAGADSTATALRVTLLYIMTNPIVYAKLRAEIDGTKSSTEVITNNAAQALPFLRAVVLEGLRMFMPLTGLAGRLPPKGGLVLEGTYIPEGAEIGLCAYAMLRRTDLFGSDADSFRPERWIEGDPKFIESMERHHSLIFGAGRSSCLGKNIAMMELRKAVFEIFRTFDIAIVNPLNPVYIRANGPVVMQDISTSSTTMVAFPVATPTSLQSDTSTSDASTTPSEPSYGLSRNAKIAIYVTTIVGGTLLIALLVCALYKGRARRRTRARRRLQDELDATTKPRKRPPGFEDPDMSEATDAASWYGQRAVPSNLADRFRRKDAYIKATLGEAYPMHEDPNSDDHSSLLPASPQRALTKVDEDDIMDASRRHSETSFVDDGKISPLPESYQGSRPGSHRPNRISAAFLKPPNLRIEAPRWSWTNSQAPATPRMYVPTIASSKNSATRLRMAVNWVRTRGERITSGEGEANPKTIVPRPGVLKNQASKPNLAPRKLVKKNSVRGSSERVRMSSDRVRQSTERDLERVLSH
ncbi:hypothetical protein AMS68_000021 [Peltaster fructicola]|uniref:Cytochrome P450 n=1 Tax=Peltaster fructicola TaxID=286661 RepID=A0A6H0XIG6_9PEZI|nr:hypothetical protein AMS68_000021 [Peltaster fructicola]